MNPAIGIGPIAPSGVKITGITYDLHIEQCVPVAGMASAILFNGIRLRGTAGSPYLPEVSLFQWYPWFLGGGWRTGDIGCQGWPPRGKRIAAPSLWVRITDYNAKERGLVGLRADTARTRRAFGIQNAGVDNIPGLTCIDAAYQDSMQGARIRVTRYYLTRRRVTTNRPGYGHRFDRVTNACRAALYPDEYAVWVTLLENLEHPRTRKDWKEFRFETLLPFRYADEVSPTEPCSIVAEFADRAGPMVVHYENPCALVGAYAAPMPLDDWRLHYSSHPTERIVGYGWKRTGKGRLTFTNDGTDTYPQHNQLVSIA